MSSETTVEISFPRFLIADDPTNKAQGAPQYVVHTVEPRFIARIEFDQQICETVLIPLFLDSPANYPAETVKGAVIDAKRFYLETVASLAGGIA